MQDFGRTPATALRMSMVTRAPPPARGLCRALASFPLGPRYFNTRLLSLPRDKIIFYTRFHFFARRRKRRGFGGAENSYPLLRTDETDEIFLPIAIVVARLSPRETTARVQMGVAHFRYEFERSSPFFSRRDLSGRAH